MPKREIMKNDVPELWRQRAKAGLCPVCGKTPDQFKKRMRIYCSTKCRDEYASKYTFWSYEREKFLEEHGQICDLCGITPQDAIKQHELLYNQAIKRWLNKPENKKSLEEKRDERLVTLSENFERDYKILMDDETFFKDGFWDEGHKLKAKIPGRHIQFDVDHVLALCNGGDMWDTSNWQVLCNECHKNKTRKDLGERKRIKNKTVQLIK